MRRDPTEFRKRFNRWKNGELVYEAGLPKYTTGKDGDETEFTNPYKAGDLYNLSSECAYFSNHTLNDQGYMMSGNAWTPRGADVVFNGFTGIERPGVYNETAYNQYALAAADNVFKNFNTRATLDPNKVYTVNMYHESSKKKERAFNEGDSVYGTHTGYLNYEPKDDTWYVTHNIDGKLYKDRFGDLQRSGNPNRVTAIFAPRKATMWNRIKTKFGFDDGKDQVKIGPTYDPETHIWTNAKGLNITGKSFKGDYGTTTYLPSGAVDLYTGGYSEDSHKWRYAPNVHRVYIGGSANEARQKYLDTDTEFADSINSVATKYNINPDVLASRIAKEGPIDDAIRHYNNTNGCFLRGPMIGPIWGLDDMGTMVYNGTVNVNPELKKRMFTDVEMENEKGRTTYSVETDNYLDGIEATAIMLKYFKDEMKLKFPNISNERLEQYATAAFNNGLTGALDLINQGKIQNTYKPFIKLKLPILNKK